MQLHDFFQRIRLEGSPHAHPASVVVRGEIRFTVLTARLLRLEWSPTGTFTDDATFAFPHRATADPVPFHVRDGGDYLMLDTEYLQLSYRLQSGSFTAENLSIMFRVGTEVRTWRPGQQRSGNLGGTRRTLDDTGGDVSLEPGLISRDGWAVFDDSASVVLLSDDGWVGARPEQSVQDWYFFGFGHAYTDALTEYMQFGGAVPLVPRYVLGTWWSRYWPYSDTELQQLVTTFAEHRLPLDVLVIDMDWHTPGYWTGYSWNRDLFPDPEAFLADMHQRGLRVTLNLHPAEGVHPHETAYDDFAAAIGMAEAGGMPIPFRITDRTFTELYFRLLHHPLEEQGVDFWWIDWQQGEQTELVGLDPLIWLNHLHFLDARRRNVRPLLFSRWGGLGNHRYPLGFSGDTFGGWGTLAAMPRFTATAANVGFGWWSHDIGGHFGSIDPELFVRWVQFGVLSPCVRLHATKDPLAERRPWAFSPLVLDLVRQAFELRFRLTPYLYTMARQTHERGISLCRPMYYAYPEHESAYLAHGQYQLGDDLIAAPITQPADPETGLASIDVWVPPGTWCRFDTNEAFTGPRWVRITGGLETIPLLVRSGAVVPLLRPALHLADAPLDHLEIRVFPGADGAFRLYEDDGESEAYLQDEYEWTTFTSVSDTAHNQIFHIAPVAGHCQVLPASRGYTVTLLGMTQPDRVVDGEGDDLSWTFNQATYSIQIEIPPRPKSESVVVKVLGASMSAAMRPAPADQRADDAAPVAHVIAYTASDDAQRQLGHLLLIPPYVARQDRRSWDAEVVWCDVRPDTVVETQHLAPNLSGETLLTSPFALDLDAPLQPRHWEVQTRFASGTDIMTTTFSGPYLNPLIQRWSLRYADEQHWHVLQADIATRTSITEPYEGNLDAHTVSAAEAVASFDLVETTLVWFDTWTNGDLSLEVDDTLLVDGEPQPALAGFTRPCKTVRFGPVALAAGRHGLRMQLTAPEGPRWRFGVLLVDATGSPLICCTQPEDLRSVREPATSAVTVNAAAQSEADERGWP
ncbi:MAG: TIM-barrel domain-containing protein [Ktedonobacterales bacterium]